MLKLNWSELNWKKGIIILLTGVFTYLVWNYFLFQLISDMVDGLPDSTFAPETSFQLSLIFAGAAMLQSLYLLVMPSGMDSEDIHFNRWLLLAIPLYAKSVQVFVETAGQPWRLSLLVSVIVAGMAAFMLYFSFFEWVPRLLTTAMVKWAKA
ncbi:MAG: hypothetical protein ACPGO5_03375 [Patescibacteria group bacterium]